MESQNMTSFNKSVPTFISTLMSSNCESQVVTAEWKTMKTLMTFHLTDFSLWGKVKQNDLFITFWMLQWNFPPAVDFLNPFSFTAAAAVPFAKPHGDSSPSRVHPLTGRQSQFKPLAAFSSLVKAQLSLQEKICPD